MPSITIVGLAKYMGTANMLAPITKELRCRGHNVVLLAEEGGPAFQKFDELKVEYKPVSNSVAGGEILREYSPDIVLTGLANTRNLEAKLDFAASLTGRVSIVNLEDYWGVHARCTVEPDLFITIDSASADLIRRSYKSSRYCKAGLAGIMPYKPRPHVVEAFKKEQDLGRKVILFTDSGAMCEPDLKLTLECLRMTRTRWRLCTSFHPNLVNTKMPDRDITWGEHWNSFLSVLRKIGLVMETDARGDEAAMLADMTISSFSTLQFRALASGKHAVTTWTPEAEDAFFAAVGFREAPLLLKKVYPVIREPQSLDSILTSIPPKPDVKPFDASVATDAILKLVH